MATSEPASVFEMIHSWSLQRPSWQRDALRRIVVKGTLDQDDHFELVSLCKKGCGAPDVELTSVPLTEDHVPTAAAGTQTVVLTSIKDVSGVNRLAPDQELPFQPDGITVIYGDNGVGKSGYARILRRACRARFPGDILPNAFDPAARKAASATIGCLVAGAPLPSVAWTDGGALHPVLSAVSVFDRECGQVHVRDKNEVAFRPFGLDIPDELVAACAAVKELLTAELSALARAQDPCFARPAFNGSTTVGRALGSLTMSSDLSGLRKLAKLSDDDRSRLRRLNEDLAKDPLKAASAQRALAASTARLATDVASAFGWSDNDALGTLWLLSDDARNKRAAATVAADAAFGGATLRGVGEATWCALWEAARRYSEQVAYHGHPFPKTDGDAVCVLCHHPLTEEAGKRKVSFENFIKADSERQARSAEGAYGAALKATSLKVVRLKSFPAKHQLAVDHPELAASVRRGLAAARMRRHICMRIIRERRTIPMPDLPMGLIDDLRRVAAETDAYATELAQAADPEGRRRLEAERAELRDRASLAEIMPKAEAEVARLAGIALLNRCMSELTTNAITTLGNQIADQFVTPRVRDRFAEEIQKLAASRVRVEIVRSGGKYGSPQYQVRLFANEKAKVGAILSEGEQTCVALAAFLTELATAAHGSSLVFDDPVSSLDHRWRGKVAERLVEEAGVRQIIVFTHDLVFVNDLQMHARTKTIPHRLVSLSHTAAGAGVVSDGLPWIGAKVKERLDTLEKEARDAQALYDANDDDGYENLVSGIYGKLRSTWERALEDIAFCGVINRHRDYINTKDLAKVTTLNTSDVAAFSKGFKKCCDQTDAHDPSRVRNAPSPPPNEVLADVHEVRRWVDSLRERQKAIT